MGIGRPGIVERAAQPYVAVRRQVAIPFGGAIDEAMASLFAELKAQSIQSDGLVFFKYDIVKMPELSIAFCVETAEPVDPRGDLVGGMLPAGRYAQLTHLGHYDRLIEANTSLLAWAHAQGLPLDMEARPDGDHFAARLELYPNGPDDEPDPDKWETVIAIKLKD